MLQKASMLLNLTVDRDLRTVDKRELKTGRIAYFFEVVRDKFNEMLKVQIFFMLFALPALALVFLYAPVLISNSLAEFTFGNYMGIGYADSFDSTSMGVLAIYDVYRYILLLIMPAMLIAGIGASGLFYCSRGFMWGEPVVVYKAFFRGIKKLWKFFVPVFAVLGVVVFLVGYGVLYHLERVELGTTDALSYIILISSILGGAIVGMIAVFMLPMFACYKFKFVDYIKNSVILNVLVFPASLIIIVVTFGPFFLISLNEFVKLILYTMIIGIGFAFIAMMWTTFAQGIFDTMINGMYEARQESERKKSEKNKKDKQQLKTEFVNPKKKNKAKQAPNSKQYKNTGSQE